MEELIRQFKAYVATGEPTIGLPPLSDQQIEFIIGFYSQQGASLPIIR